MAIRKLVNLLNVVYNSLEDMGIDHTKDELVFKRWAINGVREVGAIGNYVHKICKITSNCNRFKLPEDAIAVKNIIITPAICATISDFRRMYWGEINSNSIPSNIVAGTFLVVDNNSESCSFSQIQNKWNIQDNTIFFENTPPSDTIWIYYLGMEEDEDGYYKVSENTSYAVVEYVKLMYSRRSRFSRDKIPMEDIYYSQKEFYRLASNARSEDAEILPNEREEIVALMNDPFTGVGYISGMQNNY